MNYSFIVIVLVILLLNVFDKGLTVMNIMQLKKNFPDVDALKAEKNPLQKWFFQKYGLINGGIIYCLISFAWLLFLFYMVNFVSSGKSTPFFLWGMFILFGGVIFNNLYFFLKYSQVIP